MIADGFMVSQSDVIISTDTEQHKKERFKLGSVLYHVFSLIVDIFTIEKHFCKLDYTVERVTLFRFWGLKTLLKILLSKISIKIMVSKLSKSIVGIILIIVFAIVYETTADAVYSCHPNKQLSVVQDGDIPRSSFILSSSLLGTPISLTTTMGGGVVLDLRGGGRKDRNSRQHGGSKSRKRNKKKIKHDDYESTRIDKTSDSTASFLGDAIRDRADILLADVFDPKDFPSVSFGRTSTASDAKQMHQQEQLDLTEEGGGVEAAPTAVLANYFLKSHGGAHAFRSICSAMAAFTGTLALLLPPSSPWSGWNNLKYTFLKGTLLFAMTKHLSYFLVNTYAAVETSTSSITAVTNIQDSLQEIQKGLERILSDPILQYVFYCALVYLWIPMTKGALDNRWWWQNSHFCQTSTALLLGPILMKEVISTAFVVTDIIALLSIGANTTPSALRIGQKILNAIMSLLMTSPTTWRDADPMTRQTILATFTSKVCLGFEVLVGGLFTIDAVIALWKPSKSFWKTMKRLLCTRIYLKYLSTMKRQKIHQLVQELQSNASDFPVRFLNILLNPQESMGLKAPATTYNHKSEKRPNVDNDDDSSELPVSWYELAAVALGFQ